MIVFIDGRAVTVPVGYTVIAAIAHAHTHAAVTTRTSVSGMPRGPVCGMGICQECRVTIDGRAHQLSCQTVCEPGMDVRTAAWEQRK
ncbi:2Fe-2S iron-sulfur cluster-binding protein [Pseudoduganella ginsengisoli]|uniref:(2Fe-2S)-binding protein n=1 Tax=Pseudoduganella ginsengisoli TaxID=1462440 RepID=A0A6L6Q4Y3_9BURK|nr:(2Fe-2S)-binding protein [Pseudoduganella ginsengisoli]